MSRGLMGYAPARLVLLDITPPFEVLAGQTVCDALGNVLCLGSNLTGPAKIPLFGMYLLTSYPEVLLPLSPIKNNFSRLHAVLGDVRSQLKGHLGHTNGGRNGEDESCIGQAMLEALGQFKRHVAGINQASQNVSSFTELEIILLTGHPATFVKRQLASIPSDIDLTRVKRVISATVTSGLADSYSDLEWTEQSPAEEYDGLSEVLTIINLECDESSLQRFFYNWFTDMSSETEHLRLVLPPPSPADSDLIIKCDISEKMLSPQQLPCHESFCLHADSNAFKYVFPPSSKALSTFSTAVTYVKAVRMIPRTSLCESTLYGLPLLLSSTVGWSLDWEELEENRLNFTALCSQLSQSDQVLLVQLIPQASNPSTNAGRGGWAGFTAKTSQPAPTPTGFFVLMPSKNRHLLVKSVVCSELLLPLPESVCDPVVSKDSELMVQASLTQVKFSDTFSPLDLTSGLIPALSHASLPKHVLARAAKRSANASFNETLPSGSSFMSGVPPPTKVSPRPTSNGPRLTATAYSNPLKEVNKTAATSTAKRNTAGARNSRGQGGRLGQRGGFQ